MHVGEQWWEKNGVKLLSSNLKFQAVNFDSESVYRALDFRVSNNYQSM